VAKVLHYSTSSTRISEDFEKQFFDST